MADQLPMRFNRYMPVVVLYFFLNTAGLPDGLLYSIFLTPVFWYHTLINKVWKPYFWFFGISAVYGLIHAFVGISPFFYFRSWAILFCNFSFCLSIYSFIKQQRFTPYLLQQVVWTNLLLVVVALCGLYVGAYQLWYMIPVSPGIPAFPRLKLFHSEAAVYSLYMTPVFLMYFFLAVQKGFRHTRFPLLILAGSLALSFSLGVWISLAIALAATALFHRKAFFGNPAFNKVFLFAAAGLVVAGVGLFLLNPEHVLFVRIKNIVSGVDTSARGRTYEAFILAKRMLELKSSWFGIGLGQIKVIGRSVVLEYYRYVNIPEVVRIPNASAETLIYFGYAGFLMRYVLEGWLFFRTRVFADPFRFSVFVFIFIYQFTGSYVNNLAEYVLWMLAFIPVGFLSVKQDK